MRAPLHMAGELLFSTFRLHPGMQAWASLHCGQVDTSCPVGCLPKPLGRTEPARVHAKNMQHGIIMSKQARACAQTDDDDRPVHPPRVLEVEVLWSPFEDIVPRSTREEREAAAAAAKCG